MLIKSQQALDWVKSAAAEVPEVAKLEIGSAERPLGVRFWIWYKSNKSDLSHELILDMLQEARVIDDDRYVFHTESWKLFSKDYPGVVVEIWEMDRSYMVEVEDRFAGQVKAMWEGL